MGLGNPARCPPRIGTRPVVRVIAPCGALGIHRKALESGILQLKKQGCEVRWDEGRAQADWRGYLAGDDATRRAELVSALTEPEVDIVWIGRGGSGAARIIHDALEQVRDAAPRCVVGFSDCTSIINSIYERMNWVTYHGPVVTSLGRQGHEQDAAQCLSVLRGETHHVELPPQKGPTVEGVLRGGNLTVLASTIGTAVAPTAGTHDIWFFEDVQEAPYRLDRCLWQLKASGMLDGVVGVLLGDFDLGPDEENRIQSLFVEELSVPVYIGFPAGHRGQLSLVPIGAKVQVIPDEGWVGSDRPWVVAGD